jgi:3-methyladenine DNA glycosylase AlkD
MIIKIKTEIDSHFNKKRSNNAKRFYKTGKGEYSENDIFLGLSTPLQRSIAKKYLKEININKLSKLNLLMQSKIHEHRQVALFLLVYKFEIANKKEQKQIFDYYVKNKEFINNWDLVDLSAPHIIGKYLANNPREKKILYTWVISNKLFVRRLTIISTFTLIRKHDFKDCLKISKLLLKDKEDLIHKAVGWMLREIGNRDLKSEINFLDKYYPIMPRTMLRYAIEKFEEKLRLKYLKG